MAFYFKYFSLPIFEEKRRPGSNSKMAKRASGRGNPCLILKLAQGHQYSPATQPYHISELLQLMSRCGLSVQVWQYVVCLEVRITTFFFFFNFLFKRFLEPWLKTRQNIRNSSFKIGLPWRCDVTEKSGSPRTEENFAGPSSPLYTIVCCQGNMAFSITLAANSSSNHLS